MSSRQTEIFDAPASLNNSDIQAQPQSEEVNQQPVFDNKDTLDQISNLPAQVTDNVLAQQLFWGTSFN
jgi:hypothetical protein